MWNRDNTDRRTLLKTSLTAGAGLATGGLVPASALGAAASPVDAGAAMHIIESWPATAKQSATQTIAKYGQPQEATATRLIWFNNGPWKRTVITREEVDHDFPMPHKDVMEQFIDYRVPPDRFDELAAYDGSVVVERTKGEMSARCDKEEANFLALNLANDIVLGRKNVQAARQFYTDTIQAMMRGEKPAYTQGFQFQVAKTNQGDRDRPTIRT